MTNLNQEEWIEHTSKDGNAVILDVRTELEVEEGYIPNAQNIDLHLGQGFLDKLNELDKTKNYYVYCRAGSRSVQACLLMQQLGFENLYNLTEGFSAWTGDVKK